VELQRNADKCLHQAEIKEAPASFACDLIQNHLVFAFDLKQSHTVFACDLKQTLTFVSFKTPVICLKEI
jgi:hypothetical protein